MGIPRAIVAAKKIGSCAGVVTIANVIVASMKPRKRLPASPVNVLDG